MSASERFARLFARRRHLFALAIAALTAFFALQIRHLEIYTQFLDLLPRGHPCVRTYEAYRDQYGNANNVVLALVAREGDVYRPEVLRGIERATELLDASRVAPEVNARPASAYAEPGGPVERAVHAVVTRVDRLLGAPEAEAADTGVEHALVSSLTHRTTRDPRVRADGTLESPPLLEEIPTTPEGLERLRRRVRRNPAVYGRLVSVDERAALVRAGFVESRIDYGALFKHLQHVEERLESEFPVEVHVTGQPMLFGWTYAFATELLLVFAATVLVSGLLLWVYFRRAYGVFLPLSGAAVNVVWGLGFAGWRGYNLDPLVLVVPMLITARAVSHSVQFVERFFEEYEELGDKEEACVRSMAELLRPGTLAIATDCVGLLTISLATIPLVSEIGTLSAFWAASIAVTEMLLNRLLILYLPAPRERTHRVPPLASRVLGAAAGAVGSRRGAAAIAAGFVAAGTGAFLLAREVPVGDDRPGSPILYADNEYNVAARAIGGRFFGVDELLVVPHSEVPGRVLAPDALEYVEALQAVLDLDPEAGGSISMVDLMKQTSRLFHDNDPRWAMTVSSQAEGTGLSYLLETSVPTAGVLDPYRAMDGRSLSVRTLYADHRSETVRDAMERAHRFARNERLDGSLAVRLVEREPGPLRSALAWLEPLLPPLRPRLEVTVPDGRGGRGALPVERGLDEAGPEGGRVVARWRGVEGRVAEVRRAGPFAPYELFVDPGEGRFEHRWSGAWLADGVELRLAGGSVAVTAAAHEEIEASHGAGLAVAFLATFAIVVLSYRSLLVGALLVLSLGTAALAALATQRLAGIAIDVNTLPVQAIGVGIGVDYAIYIVDRIVQERRRGLERRLALQRAVRTTGLAVAFTASTLVVGIVFWIPISSLRFGADMSALLCVLMVVNALGALLLVPALLRLLPEALLRRLGAPRRGGAGAAAPAPPARAP